MKRKDVEKLVDSLTKKPIWIRFRWESEDPRLKDTLAHVVRLKSFDIYILSINRNVWQFLPEDTQRATILHELGHIQARKGCSPKVVEAELSAHKWAIRKARQLGFKEAYYDLINEFFAWSSFPWNSDLRRYRLAYIKAKKEGLI